MKYRPRSKRFWPRAGCSDLSAAHDDRSHRRDLLEILGDRYNLRATLITSQFLVMHWHEAVGDPTLADAILDRVVHNPQTCVASLRLTRPNGRGISGRMLLEWVAEWRGMRSQSGLVLITTLPDALPDTVRQR